MKLLSFSGGCDPSFFLEGYLVDANFCILFVHHLAVRSSAMALQSALCLLPSGIIDYQRNSPKQAAGVLCSRLFVVWEMGDLR